MFNDRLAAANRLSKVAHQFYFFQSFLGIHNTCAQQPHYYFHHHAHTKHLDPSITKLVKDFILDKNDFLQKHIQTHGSLQHMPLLFQSDKKMVLEAVKKNGCALEFASEELRNDLQVVLTAIRQNGMSIQYASKSLRLDKDLVIEALKTAPQVITILIPELVQFYSNHTSKESLSSILELFIVHEPKVFKFLPSHLHDLIEPSRVLVRNGMLLKYFPRHVKKNYAHVMEAVSNHGLALKFASQKLRNTENVILAAIVNHDAALQYASDKFKSNEEFILYTMGFTRGRTFIHASEDLKKNISVINQALSYDGMLLQYVPDKSDLSIRDREIISAAIQACDSFETLQEIISLVTVKNPSLIWNDQDLQMDILMKAVEHISSSNIDLFNELSKNEAFLQKAIEKDSKWLAWYDMNSMSREQLKEMISKYGLKEFSEKYINYTSDYDLVMHAITTNGGHNLQYASESLRSNLEIVNAAIENDASTIRFCGKTILGNNEIMKRVIEKEPQYFIYGDATQLLSNKEMVLFILQEFKAKKYHPTMDSVLIKLLEGLSEELRNDEDVATLCADIRSGLSLHYFSPHIRSNLHVMSHAIANDPFSVQFIPENSELRNNFEFMMRVVSLSGQLLCYASKELQDHAELVFQACKSCSNALEFASLRLRNDFNLVLKVVQLECNTFNSVLAFASKELQNNKEIVLNAIQRNPRAYLEASEKLQADEQVAMETVSQNGIFLYFMPESIRNNLEVVLRAVENDPWSYAFVTSDSIRNHEQVIKIVGLELIEKIDRYDQDEVFRMRYLALYD
ncbi:hypothetical protein C9374_005153 [Naegleria lovaniensis]|uniref:DUF4116 domain-containing protein n=1 Tax=Naegleria lovaniensis TaxID=51637 RepID=A0AA88GR03_NAELO|nr:uncharacterized protein C9374_005153 [Naegleria lovaniensis]KAG2382573.1 hypothetical protein C9374_005153 [Naegleria lovaniensis]